MNVLKYLESKGIKENPRIIDVSGQATDFYLQTLLEDFKKQLLLYGVINWLVFDENNKPEDEVKDYLTLDSNGNVQIIEWFEGDYFQSCSGGHWHDDEGYEINNITHYAEIPKPTCL